MSNTDDLVQCASCIGRRAFLYRGAFAAAAAALAACASVDTSAPTLPAGSSIKVSDYSALNSVGGIALVSISGAKLAVVRTADTSFVVLSRICQHQGGTVNINGSGFLCPNHGAKYNATGQWIGGERAGNLISYPTSYDAATGVVSIG